MTRKKKNPPIDKGKGKVDHPTDPPDDMVQLVSMLSSLYLKHVEASKKLDRCTKKETNHKPAIRALNSRCTFDSFKENKNYTSKKNSANYDKNYAKNKLETFAETKCGNDWTYMITNEKQIPSLRYLKVKYGLKFKVDACGLDRKDLLKAANCASLHVPLKFLMGECSAAAAAGETRFGALDDSSALPLHSVVDISVGESSESSVAAGEIRLGALDEPPLHSVLVGESSESSVAAGEIRLGALDDPVIGATADATLDDDDTDGVADSTSHDT